MHRIKGVTLIEAIVIITIVGIISIGLANFIRQTIDIWKLIDFHNDVSFEGKKALDWIIRDLKKIKDTRSINTAESEHINFESSEDEDENGIQDIIDINFDSNQHIINRSIDGGTTIYPLCRDVENLTFTYYDSLGNIIPTPVARSRLDDIRKIRVEITLQRDKERVNFFSVVIPRNLYR